MRGRLKPPNDTQRAIFMRRRHYLKNATSRVKAISLLGPLLVLMLLSGSVHADSPDRQVAAFASGKGNIVYLALGVGLPLLTDGRNGKNHVLRTMDAVGSSVLLTEGLKALTREKRPDADTHDSFPSGHVTAAFAVAAMQSEWHPRQAPLWYAGAGLIAYSRLRLHRHYTQDVLVGALLGYGTARLEIAQARGLILRPFITPTRGGAMVGMGGTF